MFVSPQQIYRQRSGMVSAFQAGDKLGLSDAVADAYERRAVSSRGVFMARSSAFVPEDYLVLLVRSGHPAAAAAADTICNDVFS